MNIRTIASTDQIKCLKTLLRISFLIVLLACTVGTSKVKAQYTTTFAPFLYNTNDRFNTNWNEPKNWSWYPGSYVAENVIIYVLSHVRNNAHMSIPASSVVNILPGVQLDVNSTFENRGRISGEGTLVFSQNIDNNGKIFIDHLRGKTIFNRPFSTMACATIKVDNIINQSVVSGVTTSLTCAVSYEGNVNNFYDAIFINHGTMKGDVTNWETDARFINHGNFEGKINSSLPSSNTFSDVNNSGSIHLTAGTSDIDVLTNNDGGTITVDGSLIIRKIFNNKGSITNNNDLSLDPSSHNSTYSWKNTGTINTNGTLSINSFVSFNSTGGVIKGSGEHIASSQWTNRGTVSPGNSPGKLTHSGQYFESGTLLIEIGGTTSESQYDVLEIGNNRSHTILTGTLEVQLINGFNPSAGDSFTILTAQARSGTFSTVILPALSPGLEWLIDYNSQDITLRVAAIIVPVTWLDFTVSADKRNENHVDLTWSTAEEINNLGFEVERSEDGRNWEQIGFLEAQNRSADQYDYEFIDLNPNEGFNYYRLKQVDYDGAYEYSVMQSIEIREKVSADLTIFPNPSLDNTINISLASQKGESAILSILDLSGKVVHTEQVEMQSGVNTIIVETSSIISGTYILRIQGSNSHVQKKWVKL